jgi:hypothetical protein
MEDVGKELEKEKQGDSNKRGKLEKNMKEKTEESYMMEI